MPSLSFCCVVHNAVDSIEKCLQQVRPLADEIICWDQSSDDGTSEKLAELADLHIVVPYKGNVYLDHAHFSKVARCDWILSFEAEDRLSTPLKNFLTKWKAHPTERVEAYWAPRKNYIDGKNIDSLVGEDYQLVLWKRVDGNLQPLVLHRDPLNKSAVEVRTPFQAWLSPNRNLVYRDAFDKLVSQHLSYRRALIRQGEKRTMIEGEVEFLMGLSKHLKRNLPTDFFQR